MTPLANLGSVIAHALELEASFQEAAAAQGDGDRVQASASAPPSWRASAARRSPR